MTRFYDRNGDSQYDANLRDARKNDYLPSHTSVLNVISNYGIEKWKRDTILKTCAELPKWIGESVELYSDRVTEHIKEESVKAPEYGNVIHNLIERILKNECIQMAEYDIKVQDTIFAVKEWIDDNIELCYLIEPGLVNLDYGFAGKPDLLCKLKTGEIALIDWKTTKTFKDKKVRGYDEWFYQLSAQEKLVDYTYQDDKVDGHKVEKFFNVVISSTEVGRVEVVEWSREDIDRGWLIFNAALTIFKESKKFYPGGK